MRELGGARDRPPTGSMHEPGAARQVGVGLEQPRAVRAQRAVDLPLDRAHRQIVVAVADRAVARRAARSSAPFVGRRRHHDPQPHRQLALARPSALDTEVDRREARAGVLEARDALGAAPPRRRARPAGAARARLGRRSRRPRSSSARVDQASAPSRAAGRSARPPASRTISPPGGSARRRVDARRARSALALTNAAWPLACVEQHGIVGAAARRATSCIGLPSTAGSGGASHFSWCQPRPRIHSPGSARAAPPPRPRDDLVPASRRGEVELHQRVAEAREVAVALDEAGDREPAREVDDRASRARRARDLGVGADRDDPVAADRERLRLGPRRVHGHDLAAAQHQIGRRLRDRRRRGDAEAERGDQGARRSTRALERSTHALVRR